MSLIKTLRKRYKKIIWKSLRFFKKEVTVSTLQGVFTLPAGSKDPISKSLYVNKNYEFGFFQKVTAFLQEAGYFKKGEGVMVDVGANNGVISIGALNAGEVESAVAIEPDINNFAALERNIKQNQLEDAFQTLNYAVSDSESVLQLEISTSNLGDHRIHKKTSVKDLFKESKRAVVDIKSNTLDNLLNEVDPISISFIWIDVQGHEGYVFQGAPKILSEGIPVISEVWPYGLKRSGMTNQQFCEIVEKYWSHYWVLRKNDFVQYPIEQFNGFLDELGEKGDFDNVIFTA